MIEIFGGRGIEVRADGDQAERARRSLKTLRRLGWSNLHHSHNIVIMKQTKLDC